MVTGNPVHDGFIVLIFYEKHDYPSVTLIIES